MDASSTGRAALPAAIAGTEILTDNVKEIISPKKKLLVMNGYVLWRNTHWRRSCMTEMWYKHGNR